MEAGALGATREGWWSRFVSQNFFLIRKLHSLAGLLFAFFLFFHIFQNGAILAGAESYDISVAQLNRLPIPLIRTLELLLIFGPLIFHALVGIFILGEARYNLYRYRYAENWQYTLQRLTGIFLLFGIGFHLVQMWWPKFLTTSTFTRQLVGLLWAGVEKYNVPEITAQFVATQMAPHTNSWGMATPIIYILLVIAAAFHAGNGIWEFFCRWGLAVSPPGQRLVKQICWLITLVLAVLGIWTVWVFSFGGIV